MHGGQQLESAEWGWFPGDSQMQPVLIPGPGR